MVCAPCMLPLLGMGAAGTSGAASFQDKGRKQNILILIALIITLTGVFIWRNRETCSTCQL